MIRIRSWVTPLAALAVLVSLVALGSSLHWTLQREPAQEERLLYHSSIDLPKLTYTDNYETCIIILNDGNIYLFSTHEPSRIGLTAEILQVDLNESGHSIADILLVMHNHWAPGTFSLPDKLFYYALRGFGFKGQYAIYHQATGRVEFMPEGK